MRLKPPPAPPPSSTSQIETAHIGHSFIWQDAKMKASSVCGMLVAAALLAVLCQTVSASKQLSREQELALDEYFASLPADIREKANHVVQGLLQVQDKESRAARSDENVFCQDPDCGK